MLKKISIIGSALALIAGVGFSGMLAQAASTVSSPATASISSDSSTGASVALPAITVTEDAAGDIHTGTQTWALPSGFVFDTASSANVSLTGTGLMASSSTVSFPDVTHFSLNITSTSTAPGSLTVGSIVPLKVKAASGTPLALGNITMSAGSINGVASSTNFGTLTQVPGAASMLGFSAEPPATTTVSSNFSAQVAVEDQFGNTVTADNARNVTLSSVLISGTPGILNGTTTMADAAGLSGFTGLSFSQPAVIELSAQSTGLANATSTQINVGNSPSTPLLLPNGTLVQLEGNPTIYIVQNGKLVIYQQGKNGNGGGDGNEIGGDDSGSSHGNTGGNTGNIGGDDGANITTSGGGSSGGSDNAVIIHSAVTNSANSSGSSSDGNSRGGDGHNGSSQNGSGNKNGKDN